jgi:hypothetical protein
MKDTLSRISNLLIVTAVFLYFTAWVYMHFYYEQFGLTTGSLKIDYSTYLVYSYNVFLASIPLYTNTIAHTMAVDSNDPVPYQ